MPGTRDLLHRPAVTAALSWLAANYIRLVWLTGRWRFDNVEAFRGLVAEKRPFLLCFWHGRMLVLPCIWPRQAPISVLISEHRDGILISRAIRRFGIGTIAGSTSRGATGALLGMVRRLKRGEYIGITPDGPRGPRMRAAPGAVTAAKLSGAYLLPISYSATRHRVLSSWDRFLVALPFSRGIVRIGEPIEVPADADETELSRIRLRLENDMVALTAALDAELGVRGVEPAPEPAAAGGGVDARRAEGAK